MHTLYYGPGTAALAVHIALEEASADYEAVAVDMAASAQRSPEYLAINPKGRVPSLGTPEGILTETPALLGYVARQWPAAGLLPAAPYEVAVAEGFASYLASTVHVAHAHKVRGSRWSDDPDVHHALKAKVAENMDAAATHIRTEYLRGPWVLGDTYSVCDPYLFTIVRWMPGDGVDMDRHPALVEHGKRMAGRTAVQAVLPLHG